MKTRIWRRGLSLLLACLLLVCALLPATASARRLIDTGEPTSLTIQYPCEGAAFQIYRVADVSAYGEYTLTGGFAVYAVSLDQPDQAGWRALAATLAAYAARDGLWPLADGRTDAAGRLTFSPLETGLYLVTGQPSAVGGFVYTPEPFLVALPGLDGEDSWTADVTANPKYGREPEIPLTPGGDTVKRRVLKVWDDGGDKSQRPGEITVQLLRDGQVWDTVTLSEANSWSYEWSGLDGSCTWQVVEASVPDSYTVTVSREGITFVVTNTRPTDIPEEPTPSGPEPEGPDTPDTPEQPEKPDLPKTGVLWWPVPLLACGGIGLFLVGWVRRRSEDQDDV